MGSREKFLGGLPEAVWRPLGGAVLGPLGASFGPLGGLLGASWGPLRASWGLPGASWGGNLEILARGPLLGPLLGRLGARFGSLEAPLGASWVGLGERTKFSIGDDMILHLPFNGFLPEILSGRAIVPALVASIYESKKISAGSMNGFTQSSRYTLHNAHESPRGQP